MEDTNIIPTLDALTKELALYYGGIAVLVEQCYEPNAGMKMLGLNQEQWLDERSGNIDVRSTEIGKMLPVWYRYGYEGVLSSGYSLKDVDIHDDGPLERLRDMIGLLDHEDGYFSECLGAAQPRDDQVETGGLADLVQRVSARSDLDQGIALAPGQLAVLAQMSERSVRNAMVAGGELQTNENGFIANESARRWLSGRRGFVATQFRDVPPVSDAEVPDALGLVEIPPFVAARLKSLWAHEDPDPILSLLPGPAWAWRASKECGLSTERILAATQLPFDIRPKDVKALAKALRVDPIWLNHQVMSALYPDAVDMLLNPTYWATPEASVAASSVSDAVTITLTASMLKNGYIDLPFSATPMFPSDALGGRTEGDTGSEVEILYGRHQAMTDIRIKSSKTISPRKRFGAWLNTELGARPGDRIRIEKTGDRQYTLSHIAGQQKED